MNPAFPEKEYCGLIFDCDGTLTDSMPLHYCAWRDTMNEYGIAFPRQQFYALGGMPTTQIIERLAREQGVKLDVLAAAEAKETAFLNSIDQLQPVESVLEVARHYRGKIPIAVASGGYREAVWKQLVQIGCHDWFDAIVTAEDTVRHKPEPDVFLKAAERLGVEPKACLVYEDADLGLQAARAAGMDCIDVRRFLGSGHVGM